MERQLVSWRFPVAKCPGFQIFSMKIHSNNIFLNMRCCLNANDQSPVNKLNIEDGW